MEESIRGKPPELRRTEHQARSGPVLVALNAWHKATLRQLSQKPALADAIRYSLARCDALVRHTIDERIKINVTATERALHTVTLGRKDFVLP